MFLVSEHCLKFVAMTEVLSMLGEGEQDFRLSFVDVGCFSELSVFVPNNLSGGIFLSVDWYILASEGVNL
jgi:hypothetical protein